jgi:hypothetical protein
MNQPSTIVREYTFHVTTARAGRKRVREGIRPELPDVGRVPRVARMVALANHYEARILEREITDYADLARRLEWTRARVSQMMSLLNLAPDIQEAVLDLAPVHGNRDPLSEHDLHPLAALPVWEDQREAWARVLAEKGLAT